MGRTGCRGHVRDPKLGLDAEFQPTSGRLTNGHAGTYSGAVTVPCRRGFIDEFRKREEVVFRYHFSLRWPDRGHGDEEGTLLPDDASVRHYAEHVIHELKHSGDGYDDPGLCMIATNEAGNELFVIPFETRR